MEVKLPGQYDKQRVIVCSMRMQQDPGPRQQLAL